MIQVVQGAGTYWRWKVCDTEMIQTKQLQVMCKHILQKVGDSYLREQEIKTRVCSKIS